MKTVLHGGVVVTCDQAGTIFTPGDVVMDGDRIAYVGEAYEGIYDVRLSVAGRLLMPGLINAHAHSGMSILRTLADDDDLMAFLERRVWPREVLLTSEDVYAGSVLSAVEMVKCGITTCVDMYFFEESLAQAAIDVGLRALITPTVLDVPIWTSVLGSWERQLERAIAFCSEWEDRAGLIRTGIAPHAPYTVGLDVLKEIAAEGHRLERPLNIHLVETALERANFNAEHGQSTVCALRDIDFFAGPVIAAHSIWLDDGDIDIYYRHGVGVAHCPQSNAKLAAGIAPLAALLSAGVQVGLGTDGAATNNNVDLWEEMRLAPLLAKVIASDPKLVPASQALALATSMGARAVHLPDIGSLQAGLKADILVIDVDEAAAVPVFTSDSYISHLVYSLGARHVESVWINGKIVVEGGSVQTVDEAEVRHGAQRTALALSERSYG
jgi:5-methylthioadenosine/S-adenosylhomocysteine deaminase